MALRFCGLLPQRLAPEPEDCTAEQDQHDGNRCERLQPALERRVCMPGLQNMGNTCYMNSVLQCVLNTDGLVRACQALQRLNGGNEGIVASLAALAHGARATSQTALEAYGPLRDMKQAMARLNGTFAGYSQEDAEEFLTCLLSGIDDQSISLQGLAAGAPGVVQDLLGTKISNKTTCQNCSRRTEREEGGIVAYLHLISEQAAEDDDPSAVLRQERTPISLTKLIETSGVLEDYECDGCREIAEKANRKYGKSDYCRAKQQANNVSSSSDVLVILLKRFRYTKDFKTKDFKQVKVLRQVIVPTELSLAGGDYELKGVVNHLGSTPKSGHYVAAVKSFRNGLWHACDDSSVTLLDGCVRDGHAAPAMQMGGDPYILFFERHATPKPQAPPNASDDASSTAASDSEAQPALLETSESATRNAEVPVEHSCPVELPDAVDDGRVAAAPDSEVQTALLDSDGTSDAKVEFTPETAEVLVELPGASKVCSSTAAADQPALPDSDGMRQPAPLDSGSIHDSSSAAASDSDSLKTAAPHVEGGESREAPAQEASEEEEEEFEEARVVEIEGEEWLLWTL